jgi:hypothetical protein
MRLRNLETPFLQLINWQEINNLMWFKSSEHGGGESELHKGQLPGMMSVRLARRRTLQRIYADAKIRGCSS